MRVRLQRRLAATAAATLMLIVTALALAPGLAQADVGQTIINRCTHHESISGFSQADYRRALKEMSATTEEYSECAQLIRQTQEAAAGGHGAGSAAGLPTPLAATPAEQKAIAGAVAGGGGGVSLGGHTVHPGVVHANIASAFSTLPGSLLAVLGVLAASLLAAGAIAAHRRYGWNGASLLRRFGGRRDD